MLEQMLPVIVTAVLTFVSTIFMTRTQARTQTGGQRDARIAALEAALDKANTALADAREKHMATVERMIAEEEELRDQHAGKLLDARTRVDELRVQVMALRAELLRRGVNPDRLVGETISV